MPFEDKEFKLVVPEVETGGMTVAMIGSTRSGKTTLLKHTLKKFFDDHLGVLMTPSLHAPVYADMKGISRAPQYVPRIIEEMYAINKKTENKYPFLVVLDDVVSAKWDKTLIKAMTIYRNSGITTIMCVQNPIIFNSITRGNFNAVLLGYMNSDESVEKVIRLFCYTAIPGANIEEKIKNYKKMTEGHYFLYIDHLEGGMTRFKLRL